GQDQDEFVESLRQGASGAVRADLALRAVAVQEQIEVTNDEVDAEVERLAQRLGEKPAKVRKDLERRGVTQAVRSDLERGKALNFLIEHATVVDEEGNPIDLSPARSESAGSGAGEATSDEAPQEEQLRDEQVQLEQVEEAAEEPES